MQVIESVDVGDKLQVRLPYAYPVVTFIDFARNRELPRWKLMPLARCSQI